MGLELGFAATLAFSAGHYAGSATQVMQRYLFHDPFTALARIVVAEVALAALTAVLLLRRFNRGASWSFLAFGTELFPWYVGWGIPYALLEGSWLGVYLLSLPLVAFNLTTVYAPNAWSRAAYGVLVLAPLLVLLARRFGGREAPIAPRRTSGL